MRKQKHIPVPISGSSIAIIYSIFLTRIPYLEHTLSGKVVRLAMVGIVSGYAIGVCSRGRAYWPKELEWLVKYILVCSIVSSVSAVQDSRIPELYQSIKFLILPMILATIGLSIRNRTQMTSLYRCLMVLGVVSILQGIIFLLLQLTGSSSIGLIPITREGTVDIYLYLWGLAGGGYDNFRATFYFSESTFYAQFLFTCYILAIAKGNKRLSVILFVGMLITFSAGALFWAILFSLACLLLLLRPSMKIKTSSLVAASAIFFAVLGSILGILSAILSSDQLVLRIFSRAHSIDDKLSTFKFLGDLIENHPFGYGIFDPSKVFTGINTSNGLFEWLMWFGVLGIPIILYLFIVPLIKAIRAANTFSAILWLGVFFLLAMCITHGPLPSYYMVGYICAISRMTGPDGDGFRKYL